MPRQPRLDAPGVLHHVMGRSLEGTPLFANDADREDFLGRLADLCRARALSVYAWAFMPNHFHLLVRTGVQPLPHSVKKLLTGYVVNFNRRHKRYGHLFQNRYKSIVCEDDPYLLELTRYIHLNPVRGGVVRGLAALKTYPWAGHAALMGGVPRAWQDTDTILAQFGTTRREAVRRYETFVREGMAQGRRPDLVGGGLIRSLGGWSQVLPLRRRGIKVVSDERVLGSGEFIEHLRAEAAHQERETLRLARKVVPLATVERTLCAREGVAVADLHASLRSRRVVHLRRLFCQVAVRGMGYSGAAVARFLGVTTSAVNRLVASEELPQTETYLNAL
jgi:putative transposase